jgi:hypothetical protein
LPRPRVESWWAHAGRRCGHQDDAGGYDDAGGGYDASLNLTEWAELQNQTRRRRSGSSSEEKVSDDDEDGGSASSDEDNDEDRDYVDNSEDASSESRGR